MEGAQTSPAWPPAGPGFRGSVDVCPHALPSSACLLWAPSSPLCWVTWAKCLVEGKEQSWGWASDLPPPGVSSDLGPATWSKSLNLPSLSFLIHKVGTAKPTLP